MDRNQDRAWAAYQYKEIISEFSHFLDKVVRRLDVSTSRRLRPVLNVLLAQTTDSSEALPTLDEQHTAELRSLRGSVVPELTDMASSSAASTNAGPLTISSHSAHARDQSVEMDTLTTASPSSPQIGSSAPGGGGGSVKGHERQASKPPKPVLLTEPARAPRATLGESSASSAAAAASARGEGDFDSVDGADRDRNESLAPPPPSDDVL